MANERELIERFAARAVGQIPVSIATSLALEGAFGIHPERPDEKPGVIGNYDRLWVNVRTLVRNLLNALDKPFFEAFQPEFIHVAIHEEMRQIETVVLSASDGNCQPVFYNPDYSQVQKYIPNANYRYASTPKQMYMEGMERACVLEAARLIQGVEYIETGMELNDPLHRVLILTHMPIDLLSRYKFRQLDLLESHTGITKDPALWYSKLTNGRELPPLPFNKFTIRVFGDNLNLINAQPIGLKRAVLQIAQEDNWTALTQADKIRNGLRRIEDPQIRTAALSLL